MFVYPPPITNIEYLSQSTISSLGIVSFVRNRYDVNIQQQTTFEGANKEIVMADNEELDPPQLQYISNLFVAADFSSRS